MPRRAMPAVLVSLACGLGLAVTGCGSTSILPGHRSAAHSCAGHAHQDGPAAPAAQVEVVCRWSAALQAGHVRAAAGYFALPSDFANPPIVVRLRTLAQAEAADATLSCGAQVISAFQHGRYINVLFRLVARTAPGISAKECGPGVGGSARTEFVIRNGRIVQWLRAPSQPGDPGTSSGNSGNTGSTV